ncbi:MAG: glycosyltransferase family 4 protein [Brevinematales bacterium]|nr:glycosyltransferase family 4 protein [Brevinematales bacterium]
MGNFHFIFSGTQNAIGGGTKLWKFLLSKPPFTVHLHYSSYAEKIWKDFIFENLIHHIHKDWKTFENRNYRAYDDSYKTFDLALFDENDTIIFDSREGIQQLSIPISKLRKNVKMIWHMQSEEHLLRKNPLVTFKDFLSLQHIESIITVSNYLKKRFEKDIIYKSFSKKIPIEVIYNGIESSFKYIKSEKEFVLFFGRYESYKNPLFLEKLNADVRYIGSTKGCTKPVNVPKEKDLGWMSPEEAASYGDIFIFPSLGEAFGLSLLEMMSFGKIVIAFDSGAFSELIENEVDGFLIKPFDVKKANEIIEMIKNNRVLKEKISANAINKAKNFTLENFRNKFYNAIN